MGGEGTIAGMIISLRNNANLRPGRKKYFTKDNPYLETKGKKGIIKKPLKRTARQFEEFQIKETKRKRREYLIQMIAFIVSSAIAFLIIYLFFGTSLFT